MRRRMCRDAGDAPQPLAPAECLGRFWSFAPPSLRSVELRKLQQDQPMSLICYQQAHDHEQVQYRIPRSGSAVSL